LSPIAVPSRLYQVKARNMRQDLFALTK